MSMEFTIKHLGGLLASFGMAISSKAEMPKKSPYVLENEQIGRELLIADGRLATSRIFNYRADKEIAPTGCDEFQLRISEGTHMTSTDIVLTSKDFQCIDVHRDSEEQLEFGLRNEEHGLNVKVLYELKGDDFYMRKQLRITSGKAVTVERIDVEAVATSDAHQPYTIREISTRSNGAARVQWRPGLGQPLFTKETATFWGLEFPAADNQVAEKNLLCGYQYGHELVPGQEYQTYKAVLGAGDDPKFISDSFYEYIDEIRVRPLRLQIQYNSWFDFGKGVDGKAFAGSVEKVNQELCEEREVPPLDAYVIDDGWQITGKKADWSRKVWPVNEKFDPEFESSFSAVEDANSELGIWLSPQCNFGAASAVPSMREAGMGALKTWMSLANTPYMDKLEGRLVEMAKQGISYFKLDGTFGHLRVREFDTDGKKYGVPIMPQLGMEKISPSGEELSDSKYDEAKIYYLTVGTERLISTFKSMSDENPKVFIVISNGAYLSPWWLMHCDAVWMINAGDAAGGSDRTQELVYRDGVYHNIWEKDKTHFPMNALFNHEPKKTETGESAEAFRRYLYMNLSRGTGFIELYLKTQKLSETDWDVLAEGLKWAHHAFPTFKRVRMHGGDPRKEAVYGYSAWNAKQGYLSFHNPSDEAQNYQLVLDRTTGLVPSDAAYQVSSPISGDTEGVKDRYRFGETISLNLDPKEIRLIEFAKLAE